MEKKPNLNSASKEELSAIIGIGESIADKVIDYRNKHGEIRNFNDLEKEPGIGYSTVEALKNSTYIQNESEKPTSQNNPPSEKPDLNSATVEQLSSILGIGNSIANRIIGFRKEHGKITSYDDLRSASGFGDYVIQVLKDTTDIR
jgi:competence protein ComEA